MSPPPSQFLLYFLNSLNPSILLYYFNSLYFGFNRKLLNREHVILDYPGSIQNYAAWDITSNILNLFFQPFHIFMNLNLQINNFPLRRKCLFLNSTKNYCLRGLKGCINARRIWRAWKIIRSPWTLNIREISEILLLKKKQVKLFLVKKYQKPTCKSWYYYWREGCTANYTEVL